MRFILTMTLTLWLGSLAQAEIVIDFEELTAFTGASSAGGGFFYNGNDGSGVTNSKGWSSGGVFFSNNYSSDFGGVWDGWSYSNVANATAPGFVNQYAAFPGGGSNGMGGASVGGTYAIAYDYGGGTYMNLPSNARLESVQLTNGTYAALSMQTGDRFAKKFGGPSGDDPDFLRVTLHGFAGLNKSGGSLGSVTVDLADFTFADNSQDYILSTWLNVDLSSMATARSISVSFSTTDLGTPTYVALDNLTFAAVPEPAGFTLLFVSAVMVFSRRTRPRAHMQTSIFLPYS